MQYKNKKIKSLFSAQIKDQKGVTFLEIIVSISLFAVSVISIVQIFFLVLDSQRNAIGARNIQENIRYAFEVMSKELRMARLDNGDCSLVDDDKIYDDNDLGVYLRFKNYHNECVEYSLENDANGIGRIKIERDSDSGYITPDEIDVNNLKFIVDDDYHHGQSITTIKADVETVRGLLKNKQEMEIQTSISSRYY